MLANAHAHVPSTLGTVRLTHPGAQPNTLWGLPQLPFRGLSEAMGQCGARVSFGSYCLRETGYPSWPPTRRARFPHLAHPSRAQTGPQRSGLPQLSS